MERFRFLGANRNFSASIGSFQGLPAEASEVILLSQRLALKYNTTPRCACQHFLTSFFQFLCGEENSLSQSLTALPAPSGREPLARRESLQLKQEVTCPEVPLPSSPAAMPHSPFCRCATSSPGRGKSALKGTAFGGGDKVSGIAIRRPREG